jgi:hypothetical protein
MGKVIVGPKNYNSLTVPYTETTGTIVIDNSRPTIINDSFDTELQYIEPLTDNRLIILEAVIDELSNHKDIQHLQILELKKSIERLQQEINTPVQTIKIHENYDDKELRSLIQGVMSALDQVEKGQEFVNERFRRDLNSLRTEDKPISQIVRVHERLPKWVRYMIIFNFLLALIGLLT